MKVEKWQPWDYLIDLLWVFLNYNDITIEKARQLGISWLVNAFAVWRVNFFANAKALVLSQGQEEANEMVSKAKFIYEHMPKYMQQPRDRNRTSWLYFGDTYSELKSLPSTDRAGTGYNATLIVRDELYNHPSGEANFMSVAPATDAGGQLIDLSAVYRDDLKNHFVDRIQQMYPNIPGTEKRVLKSGLEMYTNKHMPSRALVFLPWNLRPVRLEGLTLEEFYDTRLRPRYTEMQLDRQYPSRIEDALRISLTSSYFEWQILDEMGYDVCPPIKQTEINTYNGIVRVYKPPITGRTYIIYTDPSDGRVDPFVTGVMDYVTGELVCSATGMERVSKVAEIHDYLSRTYKATNSYEANAVGITMAQCLDDLKTPNQSQRRNAKGEIVEGRTGFYVEGKMKNEIMFPDLAFGIAHRKYVVHDREFIQQAKMVTRELENHDRLNFPVTPPKQSFDWVMMFNGLVQLCKYAPRGTASFKTYKADSRGKYALAR